MSKIYVSESDYKKINHCSCGHKPVVKKEYRSYGIITGTKYNYFILCQHCKRRSKKFWQYLEQKSINKAISNWNRFNKEKQCNV